MGVKGLYGFLCEKIEKGCLQLQDSLIKGELVIDGFNLAGKLYGRGRHSRVEGGEYPAFYKHVSRYFQQLVDCGIEPIVVCDGPVGKCISKEEFKRKREKQVNSIRRLKYNDIELPLFSKQVFIDAIESVIQNPDTPPGRIRIVYADGDGDSEIAAVANGHQCPVLSDDGDFFMFELTAGFVVGTFFKFTTNREAFGKIFKSFSDGSISCLSPDLRFMIPAIKGNDFLECLDIEYQGHKLSDIDELVKISHDHSIEDFPCDPDIKEILSENYKAAKSYYKVVNSMKLEDVSEKANVKFPKWALSCYRNGHFHRWMVQNLIERRCTLPITVEDMDIDKPSCHEASKEIRQFLQGTLVGKTEIKETVHDQECIICPKPLSRQPWPDLQNLDKLSRDKRMEIVCKVLDYDQQTLTTELEPKWQLVVAASSFWLRSIAPEERATLARALVSCFIHCQREYICVLPPHKDILYSTEPKKEISSQLPLIHCFSQWQSVYYFTVMLNQLLLEPFQYTSPGRIFDGRRALRFAIQERENKMDLCQCADLTLHEKLYRLIICNRHQEDQELYQEE